ncbi:MAG: YlxR family protein [Clostridia bacterium]|nr:YlxR family protein [Clostridia bacterium]
MRRCNGCNEQKAKNELIRIVRSPEGEISLDLTGKKSGRGAYICNNIDCLRKVRKSRRIDRTFEITIPDEVYDSLEAQIKENDNG